MSLSHDFASLAHTNEGMHVLNKRNFPQAKLDNEINVHFLLNEHGNLYFLLHNNSVHNIQNLGFHCNDCFWYGVITMIQK